jgi:hypothetical protein
MLSSFTHWFNHTGII